MKRDLANAVRQRQVDVVYSKLCGLITTFGGDVAARECVRNAVPYRDLRAALMEAADREMNPHRYTDDDGPHRCHPAVGGGGVSGKGVLRTCL